MLCNLSAEEVYEIVSEELSRRGYKWSELNAVVNPSMVFDIPDSFAGINYQLDLEII